MTSKKKLPKNWLSIGQAANQASGASEALASQVAKFAREREWSVAELFDALASISAASFAVHLHEHSEAQFERYLDQWVKHARAIAGSMREQKRRVTNAEVRRADMRRVK